jgi:hypothetical protein
MKSTCLCTISGGAVAHRAVARGAFSEIHLVSDEAKREATLLGELREHLPRGVRRTIIDGDHLEGLVELLCVDGVDGLAHERGTVVDGKDEREHDQPLPTATLAEPAASATSEA